MRARLPDTYQDVILNLPGLLAYWPCDDSGSTIRDLKGGGGAGTIAGTVGLGKPSGRVRGPAGIAFTAVSGSKVTGTATNFNVNSTDDFTYMGWVYMPTTVTANVTVAFMYGPITDTAGAKRGIVNNSNVITGWGFGGPADVPTATGFRVGRPDLLAVSKTSTTVTVSRNGISLASGTPTLATASQHWGWGEKQGAFMTGEFTGNLSDIAVLDRGLTLAHLLHIHAEGSR